MSYNTIKVKKYLDIVEEYEAAAEIIPGMLIELTSAGKVQAHSNASQHAMTMFALENELEGKGIDDAYDSGDKVQGWIATRGDIAYAILADGNNISIGDFLESDGNGYLQKYEVNTSTEVTYPDAIVGQALEAVDTSGSSGEESSGALGYARRILVRII